MIKKHKRGLIAALLVAAAAACLSVNACLSLSSTLSSGMADGAFTLATTVALASTEEVAAVARSGTHSHGGTDDDCILWEEVTDSNRTIGDASAVKYYYLSDDAELSGSLNISANSTVVLCLNGFMLTGSGDESVITVAEGGDSASTTNFYLCDCSAQSASTRYFGLTSVPYTVTALNNSNSVGNSGSRTGTMYSYCGSATGTAACASHTSHIAITGGIITGGRTTEGNGGGIFINDNAAFYMYGGTIAGNQAHYCDASTNGRGGGIAADGGNITIEIDGGDVVGNFSADRGGGICLAADSSGTTVNIKNVRISYNYSGDAGGGMYNKNTAVTIEGNSYIEYNECATAGGGLYGVSGADSAYYLNGGTDGVCISNNYVNSGRYVNVQYGGSGAWLNGCTITISGLIEITGNTFYDIFEKKEITNNLVMGTFNTVTVGGELAEGTRIGLYIYAGMTTGSDSRMSSASGVATSGYGTYNSKAPTEYFFSDDEAYECIYLNDGEVCLGSHNYGDWSYESVYIDRYDNNVGSDTEDAAALDITVYHWKSCVNDGDNVIIYEEHDFEWVNNGDGTHRGVCKGCGYAVSDEEHLYTVTAYDGDCHWVECVLCHDITGKELHSVKADYNEYEHWTECYCGYKSTAETHSGGEPTCIAESVCDECGAAYGDANSTAHAYVAVEGKSASCTESGYKAHYVCSYCGKLFKGESGDSETTIEELIIDATGHVLAWMYDSNGDNGYHWQICIKCDYSATEVRHAVVYVEGGGTHISKCYICGYTGSAVSCTYGNDYTYDSGYHYQTCTVCKYVNSGAHSYTFNSAEAAASTVCEWGDDGNDATHSHYCSVCKMSEVEAHDQVWVDNEDGTHTGTCYGCGYQVTVNHVGNADDGDICDYCGGSIDDGSGSADDGNKELKNLLFFIAILLGILLAGEIILGIVALRKHRAISADDEEVD